MFQRILDLLTSELLQAFHDIIEGQIEGKLLQIFHNKPQTALEIVAVSIFSPLFDDHFYNIISHQMPPSQSNGPAAFYSAGTPDGSRPGSHLKVISVGCIYSSSEFVSTFSVQTIQCHHKLWDSTLVCYPRQTLCEHQPVQQPAQVLRWSWPRRCWCRHHRIKFAARYKLVMTCHQQTSNGDNFGGQR